MRIDKLEPCAYLEGVGDTGREAGELQVALHSVARGEGELDLFGRQLSAQIDHAMSVDTNQLLKWRTKKQGVVSGLVQGERDAYNNQERQSIP